MSACRPWYLAFSAGSVVLVGVLARTLGLTGVSLGMLFADVGMIFTVLRISTGLVGDSLPGFLLACLRPVELRALLNAVRHKRARAESVPASNV